MWALEASSKDPPTKTNLQPRPTFVFAPALILSQKSCSTSRLSEAPVAGLLSEGRALMSVCLSVCLVGLGQAQQRVLKEVSSVVHLDTMEAGAEYCVKAQTHVQAINRSSSFSPTQCVRAQSKSQPSLLPLPCPKLGTNLLVETFSS